jgi:hypothetical protein
MIELMRIELKAHLIAHQRVVMADRSVQMKQRADRIEKDRFDHEKPNAQLRKIASKRPTLNVQRPMPNTKSSFCLAKSFDARCMRQGDGCC